MKKNAFKVLWVVMVLFICLYYNSELYAQIKLPKPQNAEINYNNLPKQGLSIALEMDKKTVDNAWNRQLKLLGKTSSTRDGWIRLEAAAFPNFSNNPLQVLTRIDQQSSAMFIFITLEKDGKTLATDNADWMKLREYLSDFALMVYRDDINEQIAQSEKALDQAVKNHDRKQNEVLNLSKAIEKNKADKIKLEKALKDNELQLSALKTDSVKTKAEENSILEEINKLREISEQKKNKLKELQ